MTAYTITLTLPETIYKHLQRQAKITTHPIDEIASQVFVQSFPPKVEEDLPPRYRIELESMAHLSDDVLWQIAQSSMNQDKVALYDILLERHKSEKLTPIGREWLTQLREDGEQLMLRKSHAYAILKNRGHQLPTLEELREPA